MTFSLGPQDNRTPDFSVFKVSVQAPGTGCTERQTGAHCTARVCQMWDRGPIPVVWFHLSNSIYMYLYGGARET